MEKQTDNLNNIQPKYLKASKVCSVLDISKTTLWRLIKEDPSFPKPIHLINAVKVWELSDLISWLESRKNARA